MLLPNRKYTNTSLTEQMEYNVTKYEVVKFEHNFNWSTQGWAGGSGMDTATVNHELEGTSTAIDAALDYYFTTKPGKKYRLNFILKYDAADSIDVKIHNLAPQTLLYSDALVEEGLHEYAFTATTNQVRIRLKRKDE